MIHWFVKSDSVRKPSNNVENKTFDAILKQCLFNTKPVTRHNETKPNKLKQTSHNTLYII